jgi:hypothetical protein
MSRLGHRSTARPLLDRALTIAQENMDPIHLAFLHTCAKAYRLGKRSNKA